MLIYLKIYSSLTFSLESCSNQEQTNLKRASGVMGVCIVSDGVCIRSDRVRIRSDGVCIVSDEVCIVSDGVCIRSDGLVLSRSAVSNSWRPYGL